MRSLVLIFYMSLVGSAVSQATTGGSSTTQGSSSGIIGTYENKFLSLGVPILAGGGGGILLIIIISIVLCCCYCKKKKNKGADIEMGSKEETAEGKKEKKEEKKGEKKEDKKEEKKEGKKKKEKKEKKKKFELKEFKTIGIESVDTLFEQAHGVLESIHEMAESIEKADDGFLGLAELEEFVAQQVSPTLSAIVSFIVEDAKKTNVEFELQIEGESVSIGIKGSSGGNIVKGIEKLNELLKAIAGLVTETVQLVEQLIDLGKTAAEFNPQDLVDQAEGLGMLEKAKAVVNLALNIKILVGAPKDIEEFLASVKETVHIVKEVFGPK